MKNLQKETWAYKTLGEIATEITFGCVITRSQLGTGNYPAVKCGDINSGLSLQFYKCINFVNPDLISKKKYFEHGDILISDLGDKKAVGKACVYLGNEKCICGNNVAIVKHKQNSRYLAYVLSSSFYRKQVDSFAQKSTVFRIYPKHFKQLKIPVPSLDIQSRIANYLDKFSELSEELRSTLIECKNQYNFYLNSLIGRSEEEVWLRN